MDGVILQHEGAVGIAQITNEKQRNALSDPVLRELRDALETLDAAEEIRAIVIAGSDKVFASGADIRVLVGRQPFEVYAGVRAGHWQAIRRITTPLIAAVSGYCLGAGCELAMGCDIVIASERARFGLPETMLGLIPGAGGTQMLPRAIGKAKAMDMILTGRMLDAEEAERAGLVSRVASQDRWLEVAKEVAAEVASRPRVAQRLAADSVRSAAELNLGMGIDAERRAFAMAFASSDAHEGLSAFLDGNEPSWTHT